MAEGLVDDRIERTPCELAVRFELRGTRLEPRRVFRDEAHARGPGSSIGRQRPLGLAGELRLAVDSRELAIRLAVQPLQLAPDGKIRFVVAGQRAEQRFELRPAPHVERALELVP